MDKKFVENGIISLNDEIIMMDGIGDFFVLETMMPPQMKQSLKKVFWASRVQHFIKGIWDLLPNYPSLEHEFLWTNWDVVYCFLRRQDVITFLHSNGINIARNWNEITEYGLATIYKVAQHHQTKIRTESSFLKYKIVSLENFNLPEVYYCISPYSSYNRKFNSHDHNHKRDFEDSDWKSVIRWLSKRNAKGVILNVGEDSCPKHDRLLNLSNKTSLAESIEILKASKGYLGVDSCLSVLAAMLFDIENLHVRSNNDHCYNWKHVYYYPQTNFDFLKNSLEGIAGDEKIFV